MRNYCFLIDKVGQLFDIDIISLQTELVTLNAHCLHFRQRLTAVQLIISKWSLSFDIILCVNSVLLPYVGVFMLICHTDPQSLFICYYCHLLTQICK